MKSRSIVIIYRRRRSPRRFFHFSFFSSCSGLAELQSPWLTIVSMSKESFKIKRECGRKKGNGNMLEERKIHSIRLFEFNFATQPVKMERVKLMRKKKERRTR